MELGLLLWSEVTLFFDLQQRKRTCPLEIEQTVEKDIDCLSPRERVGLSPESLGRGAKREVRGGPRRRDELGRGCQGDQTVRCHSRWNWEERRSPMEAGPVLGPGGDPLPLEAPAERAQ